MLTQIFIKTICAIQGPVGSTGPKGARGTAGPPVSMISLIFIFLGVMFVLTTTKNGSILRHL